MSAARQIVILGGGFAGIYTALELDRLIARRQDVEVTLVNRENFLLFTPMLHEVAASDLDPTDIVNPIHKLLKRVKFFCGSLDRIDLQRKVVHVSHGDEFHAHELRFDHLVLALGNVAHFFDLPGLAQNALTMKSLGDAMHLRNQMIALLEEADFECCKSIRDRLLTFVVAGGGFAGVETAAAMQDFLLAALPNYSNLQKKDIKVILVHSGPTLLPELSAPLGEYAGTILGERGMEIKLNTRVQGFENRMAKLSDGSKFETCTLVWTAGSAPHPLLDGLDCAKLRGKVLVDATLQVRDQQGVWALGDCAAIPDSAGGYYPPTAQHAIREARRAARNIINVIDGSKPEPFHFKALGQLASLGARRGVAQIFGLRFSGFIAWWLWRSIYLMKLPRMEKRIRVALNWTLDVLFSKDTVQLPPQRSVRSELRLTTASPINHDIGLAAIPGTAEQPMTAQ